MLRFDLNWARSNIGRKVNLHLKDGSVIVNVLITNALRSSQKSSVLYYTIPLRKKFGKVHLREIAWAERLDSHLLMTSDVA
jgi:flavoprotein